MVIVKEFDLFEGINYEDEYIIFYPSGEIIYLDNADVSLLLKKHIIYRSPKYDNTLISSDYYIDDIKNYIYQTPSFSKSTISKFLEECGLLPDQYKILEDMSIDAYGQVNMSYRGLKKIPYKFNKCTSNFDCSHNNLINLHNSPLSVHGNFNCSYNSLETLEGGPKMVQRVYNCSNNYLTTLKGSPTKLKYFDCSDNLLTDLNYAPIVSDYLNKKNNKFK